MNYLLTADKFFEDAPGGGYRIPYELAMMIRDCGHHVSLLCGSVEGDPEPGPRIYNGIRVVRYRVPKLGRWDPRLMNAHVQAAYEEAKRSLTDRRWDVINSHMPASGLAALTLFARVGKRICTIHSPAALEVTLKWSDGSINGRIRNLFGVPVVKSWEQRLYRAAHDIHVLSQYTAQQVGRMYGDKIASKITVLPWWGTAPIPNGFTKASARSALHWPDDVPILLSVRRMTQRMGLDIYLDALALLLKKHHCFVALCGDGPERRKLMQRADALGLSSRIVFPGRLSEVQLDLAYRAADAFVLPTTHLECFGMIVLESLSYGCPVIATRCGAIPEILDNILPAYQCEPGNVTSLSSLLDRFLSGALPVPSRSQLQGFVAERYSKPQIQHAYRRLLGVEDAMRTGDVTSTVDAFDRAEQRAATNEGQVTI